MNRNISRDNWTRGAVTAKLSAYGGHAYRVPHHTKPYHTAYHRYRPPLPPRETKKTLATCMHHRTNVPAHSRAYPRAFLRHNARTADTSLIHFNATNAVQQRRIVPRGACRNLSSSFFSPVARLRSARPSPARPAPASPFCSRPLARTIPRGIHRPDV